MPISPYIQRLREKVGNDLLLLPAVTAIILDDDNRALLHRSADDDRWYTIGGAIGCCADATTAQASTNNAPMNERHMNTFYLLLQPSADALTP